MKTNLFVQTGIIFGICLLGEWISHLLPFVFPANVIAMILMFVLLLIGLLKTDHIQEMGEFLRKNMAFFFIPAGVALMAEVDVMKGKILILLMICFVTMVLTFMVSAFTIRLVSRMQKRFTKEDK